jgi:eukaryotic-like serine/threonine-protein kinase
VKGEVIGGRYRLDEWIGTCAMSEAWLAHDLELERSVAVKLLAAPTDRDASPARRRPSPPRRRHLDRRP